MTISYLYRQCGAAGNKFIIIDEWDALFREAKEDEYESLKIYIDMDMDGLKQAIMLMLGGEHYLIDTRIFQNNMTSIKSKDDVLTLLVHLGYLAYEMEEIFYLLESIMVKRQRSINV